MKLSKTIILVRHGTTHFNEQDRWQGRRDFHLNSKGYEEGALLAEELKGIPCDIIFHSPMRRAIQTADIINKNLGVDYREIQGFVEIDMGDFEGKKHTDILKNHSEAYQKWIADENLPIPGGESFNDVMKRVKPGVDQILRSSFKNILVVGHALVNRAILAHLLKMNSMSARKFRMRNCAYSKILIYEIPLGYQIIVDSWNVTSHLENQS